MFQWLITLSLLGICVLFSVYIFLLSTFCPLILYGLSLIQLGGCSYHASPFQKLWNWFLFFLSVLTEHFTPPLRKSVFFPEAFQLLTYFKMQIPEQDSIRMVLTKPCAKVLLLCFTRSFPFYSKGFKWLFFLLLFILSVTVSEHNPHSRVLWSCLPWRCQSFCCLYPCS